MRRVVLLVSVLSLPLLGIGALVAARVDERVGDPSKVIVKPADTAPRIAECPSGYILDVNVDGEGPGFATAEEAEASLLRLPQLSPLAEKRFARYDITDSEVRWVYRDNNMAEAVLTVVKGAAGTWLPGYTTVCTVIL